MGSAVALRCHCAEFSVLADKVVGTVIHHAPLLIETAAVVDFAIRYVEVEIAICD